MSPVVELPTERIIWGGPYTPPTAWKQVAGPCICGCGNCDHWVYGRAPTVLLTFADNGKCYVGTETMFILPPVETITGPFCVTIKSGDGPAGAMPYEQNDGGGVFIIVDGVEYEVATVSNGGMMCVCFDGKNFVATGDAVGGGGGGG